MGKIFSLKVCPFSTQALDKQLRKSFFEVLKSIEEFPNS